MHDAAVVNASPLIVLSRAGRLDLLQVLGRPLVVPSAVLEEIREKGEGDITVQAVRQATFLHIFPPVRVPPAVAAWNLGAGESAVLAWVLEHPGSLAILDDTAARRCAETLEIPVAGTAGLVLMAKARGHIPLARPVLRDLVSAGLYLSERTLTELLRRVGE